VHPVLKMQDHHIGCHVFFMFVWYCLQQIVFWCQAIHLQVSINMKRFAQSFITIWNSAAEEELKPSTQKHGKNLVVLLLIKIVVIWRWSD